MSINIGVECRPTFYVFSCESIGPACLPFFDQVRPTAHGEARATAQRWLRTFNSLGLDRFGGLGPPARCQLLSLFFWGGGSRTKRYRTAEKKGTLILTSLLEYLAVDFKKVWTILGQSTREVRKSKCKAENPGVGISVT